MTVADQGDRSQVEALAQDMQQVTGGTVEMAYVDQGYTGPTAAEAAQSHGIRLEVIKHPLIHHTSYDAEKIMQENANGSHSEESCEPLGGDLLRLT